MASIKKLTPGQTLWDLHKRKAGNTTIMVWGLWEVQVISIDPEFKFIEASWNGNRVQRMYEGEVSKLKVKKPDMDSDKYKSPFR